MLIIGEKFNSSIPKVREAIYNKDINFIQDLAKAQAESGADYLDVNTALENEVEDMEWVIRTVQEVVDLPICIDSTNAEAIKKGLETVKNRAMINSISMESARIKEILPLVLQSGHPVVALTMNDEGIPKTIEKRLEIAEELVSILAKENYPLDQIYIDPLVLPLAVNSNNGAMFFKCISDIKRLGVKTVSGLSNISQSSPMRKLINRYFLSIGMSVGMDAAILDPLDEKLMTAVATTDFLIGNDRFGKKYLKAYRKGKLLE